MKNGHVLVQQMVKVVAFCATSFAVQMIHLWMMLPQMFIQVSQLWEKLNVFVLAVTLTKWTFEPSSQLKRIVHILQMKHKLLSFQCFIANLARKRFHGKNFSTTDSVRAVACHKCKQT